MAFIATPCLYRPGRGNENFLVKRKPCSVGAIRRTVTAKLQHHKRFRRRVGDTIVAIAAAAALSISTAHAVSGGGKDYASQNWAGQVFHGSYAGKDFSGGLFRGCDFAGSDLTSARLFKAELREANMSGVNLSYASVESAILRDTIFKDAVMVGAYISDSILDAASIESVDFTDALITPESTIVKLCKREDARGTNSTTGSSTRESLMCLD